MKTWKIKLISADLKKFTWKQALLRYIAVIFPLLFFIATNLWSVINTHTALIIALLLFAAGYLWSLLNNKRATWADIISNSIIIDLDE